MFYAILVWCVTYRTRYSSSLFTLVFLISKILFQRVVWSGSATYITVTCHSVSQWAWFVFNEKRRRKYRQATYNARHATLWLQRKKEPNESRDHKLGTGSMPAFNGLPTISIGVWADTNSGIKQHLMILLGEDGVVSRAWQTLRFCFRHATTTQQRRLKSR